MSVSRVSLRTCARLAALQSRFASTAVAQSDTAAVADPKKKVDLSAFRTHSPELIAQLEAKFPGYRDTPIDPKDKPSGTWLFMLLFLVIGYAPVVLMPGGKIDQWLFGVK